MEFVNGINDIVSHYGQATALFLIAVAVIVAFIRLNNDQSARLKDLAEESKSIRDAQSKRDDQLNQMFQQNLSIHDTSVKTMTNIANDFTYVAKELVVNNRHQQETLTSISSSLDDPVRVLGRFKPVINAIRDNSNAVGDRLEKNIMPTIEEKLDDIRKDLEILHAKIDGLDACNTLEAVLQKLIAIEAQFKERTLGDTQPIYPVTLPGEKIDPDKKE